VIGDAISLEKGSSDIITDFKPSQGDTIGLRKQELQIEEKTLIRIDERSALDQASKTGASLIYLGTKKYGILYSNQNGEDSGLGLQGCELVRLKGAPDLTSSEIALL
jgi:hypothetical protein